MEKRTGTVLSRKTAAPTSEFLSVPSAVFVCICSAFFSGFERLSDTTRRRQKESLENALWRGVTQYYALEGHYPETLDDLTENCGIQYDKKQFFIDYQIAGANILPDITVIER